MKFEKGNHTMLKAAYEISRFLLVEKDLPNMLQGVCDRLVEQQQIFSALIVLVDESVGGMITAETGHEANFQDIMNQLRDGILPFCGKKVLEPNNPTVVACQPDDCPHCIIYQPEYRGVCAAIKCTPVLYGFLIIQYPVGYTRSKQDLSLLQELADTISHALRRLFADEEMKRREQDMKRMGERYELALFASQAGLWDWNIKTGEMYTSPNQKEYLDYRSGNNGYVSLQRVIHQEDKDKVLTILNEHLAGNTDEYRIEYRIQEADGEWAWYLDRGKVVERDEKNMPVRMTGTHQNVTLQKQREQAVAAIQQQLHEAVNHERNFLQTVIDSAGDPVMVIDFEYTILLGNRAAANLATRGGDEGIVQGKKCYQVFCGSDKPCASNEYPCPIKEVKENPVQLKLIHNPYHGNGVNNTFELDVSPLRNNKGELYGVIEVARDVTDRLRIEQELRDSRSRLYRLAHHDTLTGLPNRLLFKDRLNQAIMKTKRTKKSVAIMYMDLDKFKAINDSLGHDVGDELLIEVAGRLQKQCRMSDTVARFGGDEFVFILDDITHKDNVALVADKIMAAIAIPVRMKKHVLEITTSIGIALYPNDSNDVEDVIKCADMALYKAKEAGRGRYHFYHPEQDKVPEDKLR